MSQENVIIKVNSNFHHIAGEDLVAIDDERFGEYRKKWKEWPESFYVGDFPLFIDVEVTNACNLECHFCATTFRKKDIKNGFVSFDTVKKVIEEGVEHGLYGVKFNIRGEPLLHPQIYDFVKYAKDNGLIDVYFNTNAVLLTEKASEKLIDAGLDRLSVSFEGYIKEVYENLRSGSSFETVVANIATLQSLKKRMGVTHPKIRIQTVMLSDVASSFEEYNKFWSDKVDEVGFLDYKEMKEKKRGIKYAWACPQIWQRMAVWWDGTILPCNHDDGGLLALGNVSTMSIMDAWHSEEISKVRAHHREGDAHKIPSCDGCYLRDSEILKMKAKV